jgi:SAM-dependent methyltransferase
MLGENLYRRIFKFNQYERDHWMFERAGEVPAGSRVLDIGAGSCPYRGYFSHCIYQTQDFTNLSKDQLTAHAGYGHIDYISDILSIPIADESFDVIVCTEVLEHVPEPIQAVKEFCRILKPGGELLLTAPLGSGIHQEPFHYYGGYTPFWYQRFLAENGFTNVEIKANGGFFKHFGQESIRFAKMSVPWKMDAGRLCQIGWALVWVLLLPLMLFVIPLSCYLLDPVSDKTQFFTVGYHVTARKADNENG